MLGWEATSMKKPEWVLKWKTWVAPEPVAEGVWLCRDGGFLCRARAKDPRTGKMIEVRKRRFDESPQLAALWLEQRCNEIRAGGRLGSSTTVPRFNEYAFSLLERKIAQRDIRSAKGEEKWLYHLATKEKKDRFGTVIEPAKPARLGLKWGDYFMDQFTRLGLIDWRTELGAKINAGVYTPSTVNTEMAVMKVILKTYYEDRELEGEPWTALKPFDTSEHPTYTEEEPNSLESLEVKSFTAAMRELFPQHYAMTFLGFVTGLRPSMLRPIRRRGPEADVDWETGRLKVRRSQTGNKPPIGTVKNKHNYSITMPDEVMAVLRWHVENCLITPEMKESDLLFPSIVGSYRSPSVLDKPFEKVRNVMGMKKHLSPRAMRRTYNDLFREAKVQDLVIRSISGHLDPESQELYSTVRAHEQKEALAKVISLAGFLEVARLDQKPDADKMKMAEGAVLALRRRAAR
jgi:integrase